MGFVKIPYYVVKKGNGYWQPTKAMREKGFRSIPCGRDGALAWAKARAAHDRWLAFLAAEEASNVPPTPGSIAEALHRYKQTEEWASKAARTREEWDRAWRQIGPAFGPCKPIAVSLEDISAFRLEIEQRVSVREAHRVVKIWRALWQVAAALRYCRPDDDPSFGVRNKEPRRRQALWTNGEVVRLAKTAWRHHYYGLAAVIAVAWDSSLSPVDVRSLTPAQRSKDEHGDVFTVARAKTGRSATATLSKRASFAVDAYLTRLGAEVADNAPLFRNRSGAAYSKDTLGDDFRDIRAVVFGPRETRTLADFRRSGAVEVIRGGGTAEQVGTKLANDFASNSSLQKTYAPVDLDTVRQADAARRKARFRRSN